MAVDECGDAGTTAHLRFERIRCHSQCLCDAIDTSLLKQHCARLADKDDVKWTGFFRQVFGELFLRFLMLANFLQIRQAAF